MKNKIILPAIILALLAIILLAFVLFAPLLINTDSVRLRIVEWVAAKTGSTLSIENIELRYFPQIHVNLSGVNGKVTERAEIFVKKIDVNLAFLPILYGKTEITKINLAEPKLSLLFAAKEAPSEKKSLEDIIDSFAVKFSRLSVAVHRGILEISDGRERPVVFADIDGSVSTSAGNIKSNFNLTSDFADSLGLTMQVNKDDSLDKIKFVLSGRGVAVEKLRESVIPFSSDNVITQTVFSYLKSGHISDISVQIKGGRFKDLGGFDDLSIRGGLGKVDIAIPGAGLLIHDVRGICLLKDGILRGENLSGTTEGIKLVEGALQVGLLGKEAPFHMEVGARADFAKIPPLLDRFLQENWFPLEHFQDVRGPVSGKLILGESVDIFKHWQERGHLKFNGRIQVENGPQVDLALAVNPKTVEITNLNIFDDFSNATFLASFDEKVNHISFSGHMEQETVARLIDFPYLLEASVKGELKTAITKKNMLLSTASGSLFVKKMGLHLQERPPIEFENVKLSAAGNHFTIKSGEVKVADSRVFLSGWADLLPHVIDMDINAAADTLSWEQVRPFFSNGKREHDKKIPIGGTIRAEAQTFSYKNVTSESVQADISVGEERTTVAIKEARVILGKDAASVTGSIDITPKATILNIDVGAKNLQWDEINNTLTKKPSTVEQGAAKSALPANLTGSVRFNVETLHVRGKKFDPANGVISFLPGKFVVSMPDSMLCGVQSSGKANVAGENVELSLLFYATEQELEPTLECFTENRSDITGKFVLNSTVSGRGKAKELIRQLNGSIDFRAEGGRILKSSLLLNVYSLLNLSGYFSGNITDLFKKGISYRFIDLKADIRDGKIIITEAVLNAPSIGVVAAGEIDLATEEIGLRILATPMTTAKMLLGKVPVIGKTARGSLISVPIRVSGNLSNPKVSYSTPKNIGAGLVNLMKKSVKVPVTIIQPNGSAEKKRSPEK